MTDTDKILPESPVPGLIPTLNKMGWMTEALDDFSSDFAAFSGTIDDEVLDIGCAYGVATLAALASGGRVCASDIEPRHLEILQRRVPADQQTRIRTQTGSLPGVDFPPASFGAILAARVLHFLDGPAIDLTVKKMARWLKPGGRVYLIADTPYIGPWAIHAANYESKKAAGELWPGFVSNYAALLPKGMDPEGHPTFINPLDPDILKRVCIAAGLNIIEAKFLSGATKSATGREHAGVIAQKA